MDRQTCPFCYQSLQAIQEVHFFVKCHWPSGQIEVGQHVQINTLASYQPELVNAGIDTNEYFKKV
jgi:hypothetical protein